MIQVQGIDIPIDGGAYYCTPEMEKAMDFYPKYKKACEDRGTEPWSRRAYLIGVCNAVSKTEVMRGGKRRSKDEILSRVFEHFGFTRIKKWFEEE